MQNYYDLLGVSRDASPRVITSAYRRLARQNHPDLRGSTDIMSQLNEGYSILLDPERRAVLDAQYEEMQQDGEVNAEATVVDGYLDSRSESFSASFKRQHESLTQRYQSHPLAEGDMARQHLQTIGTPMDIFLTSPLPGLQSIIQGDFTIDKVRRITLYAEQAPDMQLPILLNFFQSVAYRRATWQAFTQDWKHIAEGHGEAEINSLLSRFEGEEKTAAEVESTRQQFIQEDANSTMGRELNAKLREARLLHRYETDINAYFHEQSIRDTAYQVLNWIPALAGRVDKEVLINLFMRAALLFQLSSFNAGSANERMADENLSLQLLMTAYTFAHDMAPYFELSTLVTILKCLSAHTYVLPEMKNIFEALTHRVDVLVDVFPFYTSVESNIDISNHHRETVFWMRRYLNALLEKALTNPQTLFIPKEKVLYYGYEGLLKNWLTPISYPEVTIQLRLNLMLALLAKNGHRDFNHVTQLLSAPSVFVDRDEDGWMRRDRGLPVPNLPALGQFKSLDGMEFNPDTGEIKFQLTPWRSGMPAHDKLFTLADLGTLFSKHLGAAFFSLDPADPDMQYHPFNQMRFAPAVLEGTSLIQTMFLTDYVLKFLTVSQEVQGQAPFAFRSVNTLLEGLPAHLKAIVHDFHAAPQHKHAVHRFWIEATAANYAMNTTGYNYSQVTQVVVPEVKMVVKKHAMERDAYGNLMDTEKEDEGWPLIIFQRGQYRNLQEALRTLEGDAIIFFKREGATWVTVWEDEELSTDILLPEESRASFLLLKQTCGSTGKIEINTKNASSIYALTRQVTRILGKAHRFSSEYVFAESLTEHYQEFSQYFPEFARLRAFSQIMIFVRLLEPVYEKNKAEITGIEERLSDVAFWNNARSEAEANRRANERSYQTQYASGKAENKRTIQEKFTTFRREISESVLYTGQSSRLQAMANQVRTLTQDSPQIKEMVDANYQENEKQCIRQHGSAVWNRSKEGIRQQLQAMRSQWVKEGNEAIKNGLIESFTSALPSESSWTIQRFVSRMMDYGDVSELATLLARNEYNKILTEIASSYPFSVSTNEIKSILESRGSVDDLAERLTTWQFSALSPQAQEIYQRHLASIREAKSELRRQLASRKLLGENLVALGANAEHDFDIQRSEEAKLWIPASIHQDTEDGHHRLVYGGVSLTPKVEAMDSASGKILIQEVFSSSRVREPKTSQEVMTGQNFLQENPPGKLAELAQEQWAAEERARILAEEQARRLKQEADERARQQRIVDERRQAEERERIRQREERKAMFIGQGDVQSNVRSGRSAVSMLNAQVVNQTVALSERLSSGGTGINAFNQTSRDDARDTLVEGFGIILEEDQLFHQYITDAQGNTQSHLRVIFYPADGQQGWPAITAADYLIQRARSLGRDDLIRKLKDKGIQESSGTQGDALTSRLIEDRYNRLRTIITGAAPYYAGTESYNRTVIFRDTVNSILQEYKSRIFSWRSNTSKEFIRKWTQLTSAQQTAGKLDRLVFAISELMQEKNNVAGKSRLRDSLLKFWHTGLYLMAGEERFIDKLIEESSRFLSTPLYPVEMRASHPQSQDTVGSYLLRVLVERKNTTKIAALLTKGIEPPIDVILPKGLQSFGERNRIVERQRQWELQRQSEIQRQREEQQREAEAERVRQQQLATEKLKQQEKQEQERKLAEEQRQEKDKQREIQRQQAEERQREEERIRQLSPEEKKREERRAKKQQQERDKKLIEDRLIVLKRWSSQQPVARVEEKADVQQSEGPVNQEKQAIEQSNMTWFEHREKRREEQKRASALEKQSVSLNREEATVGGNDGGDSSGTESSDEGSVVSLGDSKVTMYKRKKVKGHSLHNMSDALRHNVVLALQEAGILDHDEELTEEAVRRSEPAMKEGRLLVNKTVEAELTKNGSHIGSWEKRKTQTIEISTGQCIQIHFYKNKVTNEINYNHRDFKVKNPVSATMTDGKKYKESELDLLLNSRKLK